MNIKKLTLPSYVLWEVDGSAEKLQPHLKDYRCTVKSLEVMHPLETTLSDGWYCYNSKTFFRCLGDTYISHNPDNDLRQFKWELEQLNHKYLSESDAKLISQLKAEGSTLPKKIKRDLRKLYRDDIAVKAHAFDCILMAQGGKKRFKALREKIALMRAERALSNHVVTIT